MIGQTELNYFLEVSKTLHISRAAERLGITQPALSQSIKKLENEVGHDLFLRTKKGVILTPAGHKLVEKTQDLLNQWSRIIDSVHEEVSEVSGQIKLGCHTAVAQYTLQSFLPGLLKEYSRLEIQLHHGLSRHMTEMVISSKIDVAISVNPVAHPDLIIKEICRDQVTLWKSKNCLNDDVLLMEPNLLQTQDILGKLAKKGIHFPRKVETTSLEIMASLMNAGAGVAILPERMTQLFKNDKFYRIPDAPVFEDRICLVFRQEFRKTERGRAFIDFLTKHLTS
jgi:LysR family transcriptional regulator, cell division regulator